MAAMRYLLLTVTLTCFLRGGMSVGDQEFQVLPKSGNFADTVAKRDFEDLYRLVEKMAIEMERQAVVINQLQSPQNTEEEQSNVADNYSKVQNSTVEQRVTLLELQMTDVQGDVTGLDEDVSFLFDEQVIQDERLFSLEQTTDQINGHLIDVDENIEGLQVTTLELDFRVSELEENEGSDGNSSLSELEERVETLEGAAADHEARITALEENGGGGGGSYNETIAFHAVLTDYDTIPLNATVEFNEIVLNEGNGYDSTTGVFTVPPGGGGLYYFSTYLLVDYGEAGHFDIKLNNDIICSALGDRSNGDDEYPQGACSAVVSVVEGDEVKLILSTSTDEYDTPLYLRTPYYWHGLNGFRI